MVLLFRGPNDIAVSVGVGYGMGRVVVTSEGSDILQLKIQRGIPFVNFPLLGGQLFYCRWGSYAIQPNE